MGRLETKGFKPQMTTHSSYKDTESKLHGHFLAMGFDDQVADAIANSFTYYMIGYVTLEGAARTILDSGASPQITRELAEAFEAAKRNSTAKVSPLAALN